MRRTYVPSSSASPKDLSAASWSRRPSQLPRSSQLLSRHSSQLPDPSEALPAPSAPFWAADPKGTMSYRTGGISVRSGERADERMSVLSPTTLLVVVASEAVAAEGAKALIIINIILFIVSFHLLRLSSHPLSKFSFFSVYTTWAIDQTDQIVLIIPQILQ